MNVFPESNTVRDRLCPLVCTLVREGDLGFVTGLLCPVLPDPSKTMRNFSVDWNWHWTSPSSNGQLVADPTGLAPQSAAPSGRLRAECELIFLERHFW